MKILLLIMLVCMGSGLDNGLGLTPPMGWNSWNHFGCHLTSQLIRETADLLISTGLASKGYTYLNLDDCWQIDRNRSTGQIIEDLSKFPQGMPKLIEYVHGKGLKFGLYSDAGTQTCQGRPGSYGYQTIDANTYAKWKVDFLKYDNCHNEMLPPKFRYNQRYIRYPLMRDALNATKHPIYFSMCQWGRDKPWLWAQTVANSWRTTIDIKDIWQSILYNLERHIGISKYAGKGAWNDPDMLQVGNGKLSYEQYESHFVLWAALKAPLLIGCALKNISANTLKILGNEEVIAINQDPLGIAADLIQRKGTEQTGFKQIWGGRLSNNRYVLVFFNREQLPHQFTFKYKDYQQFRGKEIMGIRDVLQHVDVPPTKDQFVTKKVKKHAVAAYIFSFK